MRCPNSATEGLTRTGCQFREQLVLATTAPQRRYGIKRKRFCYLKHKCSASQDSSDTSCEQIDSKDTVLLQAAPQQQQLIWCQSLLTGDFFDQAKSAFPPVGWTPGSLSKVLYYGLPAAAAAVFINSKIAAYITSTTISQPGQQLSTVHQAAATAITASAEGSLSDIPEGLQQALLHFSQEAVLFAALPAACYFALGPRVITVKWDSYWITQIFITCLVLFPLVDPVLSGLWTPAVTAVLGPASVNPILGTLQQAGSNGDWSSLWLHCAASGLLGPFWEEVFWRGFFLTALTKVLPLPACVALSSLNFAVLHLSPHNMLPLFVLSSCCDLLYLKSGGNLLAPLLLHGLWNVSQVLQIALLHKDTFV